MSPIRAQLQAGREQDRRMRPSRAPASRREKPDAPGRGKIRFYMAYHDTEWGVPEYDDPRAL